MTFDKDATIRLARSFAAKGDPNGWFEEFYARATSTRSTGPT